MTALWTLIILVISGNGDVTFSPMIGPYIDNVQCEAAAKIVKEEFMVKYNFGSGNIYYKTKVVTSCIPVVAQK